MDTLSEASRVVSKSWLLTAIGCCSATLIAPARVSWAVFAWSAGRGADRLHARTHGRSRPTCRGPKRAGSLQTRLVGAVHPRADWDGCRRLDGLLWSSRDAPIGPIETTFETTAKNACAEVAARPAFGLVRLAVAAGFEPAEGCPSRAFEFCGWWFRPVRLGLLAPEPRLGSPLRTPLNLYE